MSKGAYHGTSTLCIESVSAPGGSMVGGLRHGQRPCWKGNRRERYKLHRFCDAGRFCDTGGTNSPRLSVVCPQEAKHCALKRFWAQMRVRGSAMTERLPVQLKKIAPQRNQAM